MIDLIRINHPGSMIQIHLVFCSFFLETKILYQKQSTDLYRFIQEQGMEATATKYMWIWEE